MLFYVKTFLPIAMKKVYPYITTLLILIFLLTIVGDSYSQCPMCRAAAETNLSQGGTEGKGLNKGILYMLSLPYLLIATIGFIWWKNKKEEPNTIQK